MTITASPEAKSIPAVMRLVALLNAVARHRIAWHWVKGHSGHPENDRVDALACKAADAQR